MAKSNIPVSFDFFKRYTFHEECVDFMLNLKAKGNQQMYAALLHNKKCREEALRCYYEAFYLKPQIREHHPIRIKPVPKKIRDKLLLIPEQGASTNIENFELNGEIDSNESCLQVAVKDFNVNCANAAVMRKEDISIEGVCVEDDSEPLTSPDVSSTNHEKEKQNLAGESQGKKGYSDNENADKIALKKDMDKENPKISNNMPQDNGKPTTTSCSNEKPAFNYKALAPYIHCCPLTYNDFRKYCNIMELVREFCEKQNLNAVKQRMVLERSYILFYLAPEHRSITPLNKIQLVENCPEYIKNKFFTIPTKLYLKEKKNPRKTQEIVAREERSINSNNENLEIVAAKNTTISEPQENAVNQQKTHIPPINNINEENETQHKSTAVVEAPDNINLNMSREKSVATLKQQVRCIDSSQARTTTTLATDNYEETESNNIQQKSPQTLTATATEMVINLPVSLDEFKQYTYYEEIVERLFKIKARDNKDLFIKYQKSQEAFDSTLQNFYHSFYLLPAVRKIWPMRFKPMPKFFESRLLSIPDNVKVTDLNNFQVDQLVSLEFMEAATTKTAPLLDNVEKTEMESQVAIKENASTVATTFEVENIEIPEANIKQNSSFGVKRPTNETSEASSPKRKKVQQTIDCIYNSENTKKSYKDLLPYAHCCPITFSEFCKYTNIRELFTDYCKKRYNSIKKLPFILQRAYILYYLVPENRKFKPFNKLQVLDNCPLNLKEKVFAIVETLNIKEEKKDFQNQENTQTETQTTPEHQSSKTTGRHPKEPIEILENRLLTPTARRLSVQFDKERNYCFSSFCVFHHISCFDFLKSTNILNILPKPFDKNAIENVFKKFIYKLVREQTCDEKYVINSALLCKLLKYKEICANCEYNAQTLINLDGTSNSSVSESDRLSNATSATVVERCVADKVSVIEKQTETFTNDIQTQSPTTEQQPGNIVKQLTRDKVIEKQTEETVDNDIQTQSPTTEEQRPASIVKHLRRDKIFSKFSQRLLSKLNESYDDTVDISSDCYKIFLECNEVPLKDILSDFCEHNEDIIQRILNETELYEGFKRYYYFKYVTKYPEKIKKIQETNSERSPKKRQSFAKPRDVNKNTSNTEQNNRSKVTNEHEKEDNNNVTLDQETSLNCHNALEKAKRIFFRYVDKTHTLSYVLRTSFGYRQAILRTILTLTYDEFVEITSIYEGNELYKDHHIAECMYRYVFRTPLVWPTNLYITLENLCKFLHKNSIRFENYSTMLTYISPKLLHWSTLLSCTNILDCLQIDYEKRNGKILNTYDISILKRECIEYYNRCWKHEKWLGGIPQINEEFYKKHLMPQGDVSTTAGSSVKEACEPRTENSDAVEAVNENLVRVQNTTALNTSNTADANDRVLNSQQQTEMLPLEPTVSIDPQDNFSNRMNLNASSSIADSYEVVSLGVLTAQAVKTEAPEINLLSNIIFYEDEDSNIQCLPCEEEIICLDNTMDTGVVEENLPPSQMDFEDSLEQRLYNVLVNSDETNFLLNIPPHFPSSAESNLGTASTQAFMQPSLSGESISEYLPQLPDVSLKSGGETQNNENVANLNALEQNICLERNMAETCLEQADVPLQQDQGEKASSEAAAETINATPIHEQQPTSIAAKPVESTILQTIQPLENAGNIHQSNFCPTRLPIRQDIIRTYASGSRRTKSIATVKPLTKSGLVPQIQHNTRPLQTAPAYAASSGNSNQGLQPVAEISPPTSLLLSLTPTNNSSNASGKSMQNSSFQLQLSNLDGQIFISQELNKNCSVFDNSSLLRIVDHNYHKQAPQSANHEAAGTAGNSATIQEEQVGMTTTHNISICRDDSEQSDNANVQSSVTISATTGNQQQCHPSITTRSPSSLYGTNNKDFFVHKK